MNKMIAKIKNGRSYTLFTADRIQVTPEIRNSRTVAREQQMATIMWTGIAAIFMVIAIRHLLPGIVYAMASAGLHITIGTEAHDMMAGCIFDICRGFKDLTIEYTWVGGFLDTIFEYKFIQLLIVLVCGFGFYKATRFMVFACIQCKAHLGKVVDKKKQPVPFHAAKRRRVQQRRSNVG